MSGCRGNGEISVKVHYLPVNQMNEFWGSNVHMAIITTLCVYLNAAKRVDLKCFNHKKI